MVKQLVFSLKGRIITCLGFFRGRGGSCGVKGVEGGKGSLREVVRGGGRCEGVRVWMMKLISWIGKRLRGLEKRKEVRSLVKEKCLFILCLQETEMHGSDDGLYASFWGNLSVVFSFYPSQEASGGLLSVWDTSEVEMWSSVSCDYVLIIPGRFLKSNEEFHLFNVYAHCDSISNKLLWDSLSARLHLLRGKKVYDCGDFNIVRCRQEKRSLSEGAFISDFSPFN